MNEYEGYARLLEKVEYVRDDVGVINEELWTAWECIKACDWMDTEDALDKIIDYAHSMTTELICVQRIALALKQVVEKNAGMLRT